MLPSMGESSAEICKHCGKPRGCSHGAACVCKPAEDFNPGPNIPKEIRDGLIEIHAAVTKDRNAAGAEALCNDVLKRILDFCDRVWPDPPKTGWAKLKSDVARAQGPLSIAATAAVAGALAGWALGRTTLAEAACRMTGVCNRPELVVVGGLTWLAVFALLWMFWSMTPWGAPALSSPDKPTERLARLRKTGVITAELENFGKQAGLDPPLLVGHGAGGHVHAPPPAASVASVRSKGAFILALADQVFEGRRRVEDARLGRWTERGYSAA